MVFGASMLQENTYFMKISFVGLIMAFKNNILKIINSLKISKLFFNYLFAYVMYLFLLYIC